MENLFDYIRARLLEAQGKEGVVIEFEKGNYLLSDTSAKQDFDALMRGELDYDTHWGKHGISFNTGFSFNGIKGVTLIGNGSTLIFEGLIAPFHFSKCQDVKITGFTIEWKRPPFSVGIIQEIKGETIRVKSHADFKINGKEPIWALMDYDPLKKRFGCVWKFRNMSPLRKIEEDIYAFDANVAKDLNPGDTLVLRHVGNYRPCIYFLETKQVLIEDTVLLTNPGMGVVGHYSSDLEFRRLQVRPKKNHLMSTTTDATHFISCEGAINFEECYFEGMGDDAVNVHGFYNYITKIIDDKQVEVTILNENGTQDQIFDAPRSGDEVEFARVEDLSLIAPNNTVKQVVVDKDKWRARITFAEAIDHKIQVGDLLTKTNDVASLRFAHCHIKSVRARACLIQTRNVIIENCRIENCTGTGIHVDTATGWWESVRCENIQIRHNTIIDCGYGDGTYLNASGIAVMTEAKHKAVGIHQNICIENNTIYGSDKDLNVGIAVECADNVRILNNTIKNCAVAIDISSSDHLLVQGNDIGNQAICYRRGE